MKIHHSEMLQKLIDDSQELSTSEKDPQTLGASHGNSTKPPRRFFCETRHQT